MTLTCSVTFMVWAPGLGEIGLLKVKVHDRTQNQPHTAPRCYPPPHAAKRGHQRSGPRLKPILGAGLHVVGPGAVGARAVVVEFNDPR